MLRYYLSGIRVGLHYGMFLLVFGQIVSIISGRQIYYHIMKLGHKSQNLKFIESIQI